MVINPRCTVCRHHDRIKIDTAINAGASLKGISEKSGLSMSALHRHRTSHMDHRVVMTTKKTLPKTIKKSDPRVGDFAHQVGHLFTRSLQIMDKAEDAEQWPSAVAANRQALNCLEVYFKASEVAYKMKNKDKDKVSVEKMRGVILDALKEHPEVRVKVADALSKIDK